MKRAIEDSFPIVEINRLAVPERNSFKPIYQMHKWFARRASCVFRAILLGALKPLPVDKDGKPTKSGAQVIMDEFYRDHTHDPDTNGKVVLDPFMGGGTTVVEALRLGCKVTGIDLNPVAWFVVKTEIEPVDLDELRAAFERLAERKVEWSGKPLRETLLDLYRTRCPSCGGEADIIYTFWVKSAICTDNNCRKQIPLFGDYIVSQKTPSIRYLPDCDCPECGKAFDWEIEPATMVADTKLMVNASKYSAGQGRTTARWSYASKPDVNKPAKVVCPWCAKTVSPRLQSTKPKRKKVELSVLLCPKCEDVWQFRGPLADEARCPGCGHSYDPKLANLPDRGKVRCACGNDAKIIDSIRALPEDQLLPMHPYGVEAYCPACDAKPGQEEDDEEDSNGNLFSEVDDAAHSAPEHQMVKNPNSILWKNSGKYYARITPADLACYQKAGKVWEKHKAVLPHPKSKIPKGQETTRLLEHHYLYWHQMFNSRQLLALTTLMQQIADEKSEKDRELLLCAFSNTLEANNMFTRQITARSTPGGTPPAGVFARHDFQPKMSICEQNVWGTKSGNNTFTRRIWALEEGVEFRQKPWDAKVPTGTKMVKVYSGDILEHDAEATLQSADSRKCISTTGSFDLVVTDPPYAGNVNYSELSDFFYVWLRLALRQQYPQFAPEYAPKAEEIVENATRGTSTGDFEKGMTEVFCQCNQMSDGLLVFTFHHADNDAWYAVLNMVCNAGFEIVAVYPVHAEREQSLHLLDKESAISYDLIHVCKKRTNNTSTTRSWANVRQAIRQRARAEIKNIESGRYGNEPLSPMDRNLVLIGKCLELYSEHFGKIVDHEGIAVPLQSALEEIKMMVDQLTTQETALPAELEDSIDPPSYVYLTCLCDRREVPSDEVSKATKGITEPSTLMDRDLMIKGRAKRGRTYEVKSPIERLDMLKKKFGVEVVDAQATLFDEDLTTITVPGVIFIDYVHFLLGLAETGESVLEWLEKFRGKRPQIWAALEYLAKRNRTFLEPVRKIMGLMDEKTLFTERQKAE